MKDSSYSKQVSPNYVIVSIALVQSELFWVCSVIFCLLRESRLLREQPIALTTRRRANSAPTNSSKRFSKNDFVRLNNDVEQKDQTQRRLSLPTEVVGFRVRPSAKDEFDGTTCPPLWWQKTRVKLGHAAVHGDPKPTKSISNILVSSASVSSVESSSPSISASPTMSHKSTKSPILSPSLTDNKYLFSLSPVSTSRSIQSCSSTESISLNEKQSAKRKLMSKLNAALQSYHHRRNRSTDSKPM